MICRVPNFVLKYAGVSEATTAQKYIQIWKLVLDVVLQYLMEYNDHSWNKCIYNTWTIGRLDLATTRSVRSCALWSRNRAYRPMQWQRVLDES